MQLIHTKRFNDRLGEIPKSIPLHINGYSQKGIAGFLEAPVTTVKNQLHDSRKLLEKRMITNVQDNLQEKRPSKDDQFITEIFRQFKDEDESTYRRAKKELVLMGKPAVPTLIRALSDPDERIRIKAVDALGEIRDYEAVPALIQELKDDNENPSVRSGAAYALRDICESYALRDICRSTVVPALIEALRDGFASEDVFMALDDILGDIGESAQVAQAVMPTLIQLLRDGNPYLSGGAASVLSSIGSPAVPKLIEVLRDENPMVRQNAVGALQRIGGCAQAAVPELMERLKDQDASVRLSAAIALGDIDQSKLNMVIPLLLKALKDAALRDNASYALNRMFSNAQAAECIRSLSKEAMPALIEALRDGNQVVRAHVAPLLGNIADLAKDAVPALIEALKDGHEYVRNSVAWTLRNIGPDAKEAVPALIQALTDETAGVRATAAGTLGQIGESDKEVLSALMEALGDEDGQVRVSAALALYRLEPSELDRVIPILTEALNDEKVHVRADAAWAVAKIGEPAKDALPKVIEALQESGDLNMGYSIHHAIEGAFVSIGAPAVPALIEALKHEHEDVRAGAALILGRKMMESAKPAIPMLIEALRDETAVVRCNAAYALGWIGKSAEAAVPTLLELLSDKYERVRSGADWALGRIR